MKNNKYLFSAIAVILLLTACAKSVRQDSIYSNTENTKDAAAETMSNTDQNKVVPGNSIKESGIVTTADHTGLFSLSMSGYKGEIFIGTSNGTFYGTIKFFNWGNGVPQPLTDLKVTEKKIYFKRVIKTKEDLKKYGGTAFFEQDFYGIFTEDKKTIKGYYRYTGTQDNWEAVKK